MSEAQERQAAGFDPTGHASPGQQLRHEREHQGLSLEEVALQLNLRPAVVAGLEGDRYDEVPIAAYRRGYLRAYARLLGIDERPVVNAYNAQHGQGDIDRKVASVNTSRPPSRIGAWVFKLVTVLVILGLIGLTLLWWQSRNGNELFDGLGLSESVEVESVDGEPVNDGAGEAGSGDTTARDGNTSLPPLPAAGEELGLVNAEGEASDEDNASVLRPQTAPTSPGSAADDAATADDVATAADADETSAADTGSVGEAEAAPAVDNRRLTLIYKEQSWTEITDANGERILVGLQSPGTQATAEGDPPFRLTIGNASGVELRYRGEPVDLGAHAGGTNVARFTLGE